MDLLSETLSLTRLSAAFPEPWFVVGREIHAGSRVIAQMLEGERGLLLYLCRLHNLFHPLANNFLMMTKTWADAGLKWRGLELISTETKEEENEQA